jgi:LmbE family N-acetylglucosaminyl deacetylase
MSGEGRKVVLVVVAHPDDEVLGCGGTMAKHVQRGDDVHVFILGEGMTSRAETREAGLKESDLALLKAATEAALGILGVKFFSSEYLPDNRFDEVALLDIVKLVERRVADVHPHIIYTHHAGDLNIDHSLTFQAVMTACRPQPGRAVRAIYSFEQPSSTEWADPRPDRAFVPNTFADITETLDLKLEAMACYRTEIRDWPHPRSLKAIEHLARWRGATVGVEAAEAFALIRRIEDWV